MKKYGVTWPDTTHPASIELEMIRHGGRYQKRDGSWAGEGLPYHYQQFQRIIWPEKVWHKWNRLLLEQFCTHRMVGVVGSASSGKTREAGDFALTTYYAWPDCTTVLVSTTEREMLEMRVWGEIKKAHKLAKERCEWIPGALIESRQRIVTDAKDEDSDGRDFRNGLCFTGETLVSTPSGKRRIDTLRAGECVMNATGVGKITKTYQSVVSRLVRVRLSNGRHIDCTANHPFFTRRGWVEAVDLETYDTVFSTHDTVRLLRETHPQQLSFLFRDLSPQPGMPYLQKARRCGIPQPEILLSYLSRQETSQAMHSMRKVFLAVESKGPLDWEDQGELLRSCLCQSVGSNAQGLPLRYNFSVPTMRKGNGESSLWQKVLLPRMQIQNHALAMSPVRESFSFDARITSEAENEVLRFILQEESAWAHIGSQKAHSYSRGVGGMAVVSRFNPTLPHTHWTDDQTQSQALVPNRHSLSFNQAGNRNKWRHPSDAIEAAKRPEEETDTERTWVESVSFLERTGIKRSEQGAKEHQVYNLQVDTHPSYYANGVLVHNCGVACKRGGSYVGMGSLVGVKNKYVLHVADELQFMPSAFVDAISNLNKNRGFKCIGIGNPKDITDCLGKFCEPSVEQGGWEGGIDQTGGTKTWATKWPDGVAVQLVGSDSPNMSVPPDAPEPYPFLIGRKEIEADIAFYGRDSLQFSMMDEGRFPRGIGLRRVITRQMCQKFGALEEPIWRDDKRTHIGGLDAAYGSIGGDRCVFIHLQIGRDVEAKQILALTEVIVVPIDSKSSEMPEDQIANFVMNQCAARHIIPENFFFDSTGRGSLMGAFARLWSPHVQPIEFGGRPSERPISQEQQTTCREYYFNFVSELWFTVRLIIMGGQFRGLTEEVMNEGCMREWKLVGKNKTQVETKAEMKLKMARSPDLFDALVAAVEGARRRGFAVTRLSGDNIRRNSGAWKQAMLKRMEKMRKRAQLTYS